jgi:phosphate binding protein
MTHRFRQTSRQRIAKIALVALVAPLMIGGFASGASAAKLNDSCKRRDLFEVEKITNKTTKKVSYIRCMVSKGSSLHAAKPKFSWQKITKAQFSYSTTKTSSAVRIDGSSTVYPLMAVAAKYFEATTSGKMNISIGISGTGGGMEKFCKGEIDMANASRAMSAKELAECVKNGVTFTEVLVANDGLAVVVNPQNPLTCIKISELKTMWQPATGNSGNGAAKTWADAVPGNTLGALKLYGAGSDSGTFDSFNTFVHGSSSKSRTDYQATENDNVTVKGVAADKNAIGYYGLSYAEENKRVNKALALDKGA